jgi:peptidoglycan/xylan/chitin deacetylase (PgdA/CDA1 family)
MLLKRFLALAAGVMLFIAAYISYFDVSHRQMEERFRAEREKFNVENTVLTAAQTAPATSAPSTATVTPAPSPTATPDTNILIGPVPPPSSNAPDSSPAPATNPAPIDPNAAPLPSVPASSGMNDFRASHSSFFQFASYRPSDGTEIQALTAAMGATTDAPASTGTATPADAATNTTSTPSPVPATNAPTPAPALATPDFVPEHPANGEASVIVLLYHQFVAPGVAVAPKLQWTLNQDVFESEMKYIHDNGYHVVPISDVLRFIKHEITLPPGSVAITIDDGYKSAIVYAAPILKKYGYPWTYFIYPDFITVNEGRGAASWNDLLQLQSEGVDIESHSMSHPTLTKKTQKFNGPSHLLTPDEYDQFLTRETLGSKTLLEEKMGKTITCFAYPYGAYNKQVEAKALAAGYEAIFTVADNPVHSTTDPHSIGRYTITRNVVKNFAAYLHQSALSLVKTDPEPGATINNPRPIITAVLEPLGAGALDPNSLETQVRDFGIVKHDFDPTTKTVRLYLPRDLISTPVLVNLRVKDATTGQILVANWHFNYEPGSSSAKSLHAPLSVKTNSASTSPTTNEPTAVESEPLEKSSVGTPMGTSSAPTH